MSLFSSIKEKIPEKIKKDPIWKTSSQITSTLNEFSTVEKATLTFENVEKPIKVQINPSDLTYEYQTTGHLGELTISSLDGKPGPAISAETHPYEKGSLSFMLYYDFYDEYYARSANGSGFSLNSLTSSFHLKNEKFSSLETIIEQSKIHAPVFFKWGEIEEFGFIQTASPRYSAFSPWGEPLKATINIVISILNFSDNLKNNDKNARALTGKTKEIYYELKNKLENGTSAIGGTIKKLGSTIKALR